MELVDLRDKIQAMHSDMFKTMLGLNELPQPLLERYFLVKKLLDKVDGSLAPCDLIRIALDCGFNPESMRFEACEVTVTGNMTVDIDEPEEEDDNDMADAVHEATAEAADDVIADMEEEGTAEEKEKFPIGRSVSGYDDDGEVISGVVNSSKVVNGERIYAVDTGDGETTEISEDEIEVN